jgi:biotin synthase
MKIDPRISGILEKAQEGVPPSKRDCALMLDYPAASIEASALRAVADAITRQRFGNEAMVLGQIGIDIDACSGQCKFCRFADNHTRFAPSRMSLDDILAAAGAFTASGDLYALFLMTTHKYDFNRLLDTVRSTREQMPSEPQIVVNIMFRQQMMTLIALLDYPVIDSVLFKTIKD